MKREKNFKVGDLVKLSFKGKKALDHLASKFKGVGIILKALEDCKSVRVQWITQKHTASMHEDYIELVKQ